MNQPEVRFEKNCKISFYSVRHIFTFMGLSTKFCHKVLPERLVLLSSFAHNGKIKSYT